MYNRTDIRLKPTITINTGDYKRLAKLALAAARLAEVSEALLIKLDRGHVVVDADMENIVRVGSTVRYKPTRAIRGRSRLSFPATPTSPRERYQSSIPSGPRSWVFRLAVSYLDRP